MHAQAVPDRKVALCLAHGVHVGDQPAAHMGRAFIDVSGVVFKHHDVLRALQADVVAQCPAQQGVGHAGVVLVDEAPVGPHEQAITGLGVLGGVGHGQAVTLQDFFKQGLGDRIPSVCVGRRL